MNKTTAPRTGIGFDAHDYSTSGVLKLGGLTFSELPALKGHSDGDALIHAVIDAILGAASAGDIGELFPDNDPKTEGISSAVMLAAALRVVAQKGLSPSHIDITVVADRPRLTGYKKEISNYLADQLEISPGQVNVKGKSSEGIRLFNETGGVAAWAVATLISKSNRKA